MDEECHDRQADNGIEERDIDENDLAGARKNDIDLVKIVVLKNQDDDKSIEEEKIEFRRQDVCFPLP